MIRYIQPQTLLGLDHVQVNCNWKWIVDRKWIEKNGLVSHPKFYPTIHFQLQFTCTWSGPNSSFKTSAMVFRVLKDAIARIVHKLLIIPTAGAPCPHPFCIQQAHSFTKSGISCFRVLCTLLQNILRLLKHTNWFSVYIQKYDEPFFLTSAIIGLNLWVNIRGSGTE